MTDQQHKNENGHKREVIEHGVLIEQLVRDVKDIKEDLGNHITEVYNRFEAHNKEIYEKFDKYKTLFISILVTLIFTLIGVIMSVGMQFFD